MLVVERRCETPAPATERLVLPFESRCRSRLRTRLESGEEAGLFLPRGTVLRGGDLLQGNDGRVVEVVAAPEPLMLVGCADPVQLARIAYHLGNRHVPVEVGEGWLRFEADHVLGEMVRGLKAAVEETVAPFEPEAGAYGAGHRHGEGESSARIHEYRR